MDQIHQTRGGTIERDHMGYDAPTLHAQSTERPTRAAPAEAFDAEIYGSFWIDQTEFALPVDAIQEVVNEPGHYAPVPLSPPYMLGVFNLRKLIVPVIDLRKLLGYPECGNKSGRRVAIIENGDLCLGLLFDDTGGILHSEGAPKVKFETNSDGVKDVVVQGILKLDDGKRMVQILDPFELLGIDHMPRVAKNSDGRENRGNLGKRYSCISFQIGHTNCALDLRYVQEILDMPELLSSPFTHGPVLGNINLRGNTIPVVDFRGLFGDEFPNYTFPPGALQKRKLIILGLPEGQIGLLVFSIDSIITYFEKQVMPFAKISLPRQDVVEGCLVNESEDIIILLDYHRLKQDDVLATAARSCREISPPDTSVEDSKQAEKLSQRKTLIVFSVDTAFALDTACVSEVINRPEKLLKPPYSLKFVEGILNLRGELITLINPRLLYDMPVAHEEPNKILIFRCDGEKYGILVDSIDEIVTIASNKVIDVPTLTASCTSESVSQDICGCMHSPKSPEIEDPVMILDVKSLIDRCACA